MTRVRIVADENIPRVRELFERFGEVVLLPGRSMAPAAVAHADILLVRSVTCVDQRLLGGSRVCWVGSATIGTDHLDTAWLDAAGIAYASAPGSNADSVGDYVLSALAVAGNRLEQLLTGHCRAAVVGTGNVGGRLVRRLAALDIDVIGCDPPLAAALAANGDSATKEDLPLRPFAEALQREVVLVHTPLTRGARWPTHHLFDAASLGRMAPGALLLNAGRGAVVDNAALGRELSSGRLTAVLDVWEREPAIDEHLLESVLIGTPHIAGYSFDGKLAGVRQLLDAYCRFAGLPFPAAAAALVTPVAAPRLRLDPAATDAALLRQAILGVYDVREDDGRLRAVGRGGEPMASGFDRLRRDYPVRREISQLTVANWDRLASRQQRLLMALGVSSQ